MNDNNVKTIITGKGHFYIRNKCPKCKNIGLIAFRPTSKFLGQEVGNGNTAYMIHRDMVCTKNVHKSSREIELNSWPAYLMQRKSFSAKLLFPNAD